MATILREGKTPKWGVTVKQAGIILDSFNISTEIKDYEQTDQNGAVCGYLVYDQTQSFDFSGVILAAETPCVGSLVGEEITNFIGSTNCNLFNNKINTLSTAIVKSVSMSQTAGGATTVSGSGTIYALSTTDLGN